MTKTEKATRYAEAIALDDSHGYSQYSRTGNPDYDCSSLVLLAYEHAGVPVWSNGARSTWNMVPVMLANGFEEVTDKVNLSTQEGLKRGDVLFIHNSYRQHTAIYCGNGKEVEAYISEIGDIYGQPGDQTGREILIQPYRQIWAQVFRYKDAEKEEKFMLTFKTIKYGDKGKYVKTFQAMLRGRGFIDKQKKKETKDGNIKVDGKWFDSTQRAWVYFQEKMGLEVKDYCDETRWKKLLYNI